MEVEFGGGRRLSPELLAPPGEVHQRKGKESSGAEGRRLDVATDRSPAVHKLIDTDELWG